ncbi:hypothetical protein [Haladaptatus sp. R4]|nr:hypothetical protein [Haladaptatus sp. R4]
MGLVPVLTPVVTSVFRPDESISARGVVGVVLGFVASSSSRTRAADTC